LILRNGRKSALATFDSERGRFGTQQDWAYGITPRNAEQAFALNALLNPDISLVTVSARLAPQDSVGACGRAGMPQELSAGLHGAPGGAPVQQGHRLPTGDIQSKLDPYMQPLFDNLGSSATISPTATPTQADRRIAGREEVGYCALAYIRGRSLVGIYFIVDEAQNLTPHEVKTIITVRAKGPRLCSPATFSRSIIPT